MKKRKSNMELLRIVSMLFIICHHLIINGIGWTNITSNKISDNYTLYVIGGSVESFLVIGVNLFFLLSGYFMINFNWKKWIKLILTLYIYMLIIQLFGVFTGYQTLNKEVIKRIVFPIDSYWFLKVYLVLMLVAPLLGVIINNAEQKIAKHFFLIFLLVFCMYTFLDNSEHLGVNRGYSFISACCLYLIGAFIKKNYLFNNHRFTVGNCLLAFLVLGICNTVVVQLAINLVNNGKLASVLCVYNNPLIALESVAFFLIFTKIEIKDNGFWDKTILWVSPHILSVYILHSSNKVINYYRNIPMKFLVENDRVISAYLLVIPYSIAILLICVVVDIVFQFIFGKIINIISDKIGSFVDKLYFKYVR